MNSKQLARFYRTNHRMRALLNLLRIEVRAAFYINDDTALITLSTLDMQNWRVDSFKFSWTTADLESEILKALQFEMSAQGDRFWQATLPLLHGDRYRVTYDQTDASVMACPQERAAAPRGAAARSAPIHAAYLERYIPTCQYQNSGPVGCENGVPAYTLPFAHFSDEHLRNLLLAVDDPTCTVIRQFFLDNPAALMTARKHANDRAVYKKESK